MVMDKFLLGEKKAPLHSIERVLRGRVILTTLLCFTEEPQLYRFRIPFSG